MMDSPASFWHRNRNDILEIFERTTLLLLVSLLSYRLGRSFLAYHEISVALYFMKEAMTVLFVMIRPAATSYTPRFHEWLAAYLGSIVTLLFTTPNPHEALAPLLLQSFGVGIAVIGVLSLNRSFGIVPANRGVKTHGLYRLVRHPIYMGYAISYLGLILNHPNPRNFLLYAAFIALSVIRIRFEERHLAQSEEYRALVSRTRYRLIPGIW